MAQTTASSQGLRKITNGELAGIKISDQNTNNISPAYYSTNEDETAICLILA
jgi:hypothetical protein